MPQNNLSLVRSKSTEPSPTLTNYTMCPNWLYDTVLVNESASVAKVVLYINRNTTGRNQAGHRAETVQASYGVIAREMNMSVRAVGEAVRTALAKGYLIQVKAGRAATPTTAGEGSWYALNWQWPIIPPSIYVNLETPANLTPNKADKSGQEQLETPVERVERQKLPGEIWQKLPVDINKAESESNKKIELMTTDQELPDKPNEFSSTFDSSIPKPKRRGSKAIGRLITDFTRELGDAASLTLPNIGRALNLWNRSDLTEANFVALLYEARKRVLSQTGLMRHKRLDEQGAASDYPNRIPYFFRVVESLLANPLSQPNSRIESLTNLGNPGIWQDLYCAETDAPTDDIAGLQTNLEPISVGTGVGAYKISSQDLIATPTSGSWSIKGAKAIHPYQEKLSEQTNTLLDKDLPLPARLSDKREIQGNCPIADQADTCYQSKPKLEESALTDSPARLKLSEEVKKWADCWSSNAELVKEKWQILLDNLPAALRQLFEGKTLIIAGELATPSLLAATGLSRVANNNKEATLDLILICRNPFELRYLSRYLPDLIAAISLILEYEVQIWPISL